MAAAQLTADVEPRVFEDQFTNDNTVLYVDDVKSENGPVAVWNGVFIADLTPPAERKTGVKDASPGPRVTVAREALAVPDVKEQPPSAHAPRLWASRSALPLDRADWRHRAAGRNRSSNSKPSRISEMFTRELQAFIRPTPQATQDGTDARIELHRRFALPVACLMLAMVGIPLGASSRKGGRSAGYIWAIFLAFFCYYLALHHADRSGAFAFHARGTGLLAAERRLRDCGNRHDRAHGSRRGTATGWATCPADDHWRGLPSDLASSVVASSANPLGAGGIKFAVFQILDSYVLSSFLFYFVVTLCLFGHDGAGIYVLRPARRHRQEQHPDVARRSSITSFSLPS